MQVASWSKREGKNFGRNQKPNTKHEIRDKSLLQVKKTGRSVKWTIGKVGFIPLPRLKTQSNHKLPQPEIESADSIFYTINF